MTQSIGLMLAALGVLACVNARAEMPLIDAHIHYSHDAWAVVPAREAIDRLRAAGLRRVFVSSSSDEGTQRLYAVAPEFVVPVLRPYRKRGELSTWMRDPTVLPMLRERIEKYRYAGIGEFHADGRAADTEVVRGVIKLASDNGLFLHAHSDTGAIRKIFVQDPDAVVLWAHAGFVDPPELRAMLAAYPTLRCDLSFRQEIAWEGDLNAEWRALFLEFPERFLLGTDTYTPSRWFELKSTAGWARAWLASLPVDVARKIAYGNAEALLALTGYRQIDP